MEKIFSIADLDELKRIRKFRQQELFYLREQFSALQKSLHDGEEEFTLEKYGPIVLLEEKDNLYNLSSAYISKNLFQTIPEEIKEVIIGEKTFYQIMILCNNEFMPIFFVPEKVIKKYPEFPDYLKQWR
ncbi:MAG: hypothetical protein HQM08_18870 [Candidatus Riflebacteria bacterium]|nr:hypothetical protein [Candidatus Riflebacteria bacterium]